MSKQFIMSSPAWRSDADAIDDSTLKLPGAGKDDFEPCHCCDGAGGYDDEHRNWQVCECCHGGGDERDS